MRAAERGTGTDLALEGAESVLAPGDFTAYAAGTLLVLDLVGTFVFALSGAAVGVQERLDLFGVLVLSCAAGNAGGLTRDVLIGAVPPEAISDWRYVAVSLLAGVMTFLWHPIIHRLHNHVLMFDGDYILFSAVLTVAGSMSEPQLPTKK